MRRRSVFLSLTFAMFFLWCWPYLVELGHRRVEKSDRYLGKSISTVLAELGEATVSVEFPMSDCGGEFRVELKNFYPPNDPASASVRIQEFIWKYRAYSLAIWFHETDGGWTALDTCRWQNGIVF